MYGLRFGVCGTAALGNTTYYLLDVARVFPPVSQKHAPYPAQHLVT